MSSETDYLVIGEVLKPFGVKGEVKVHPITDRIERFRDLSFIFIKKGEEYRRVSVESVSIHGNSVCLKLSICATRDDAGSLAGELLYVDRDHAARIEENSHYYYDLIGCSVKTTDGHLLGTLYDIRNAGSCDVYFVRPVYNMPADEGSVDVKNREILIPAISQVVKKIDTEKKEIIIEPMDGLF